VRDPTSKNKAATMPAPALDRDAIAAVLDYIDRRSGAPVAVAAPAPPPEPTFTSEDVGQGRALFTGTRRLANGGPACLSCHDAGLDGNLGGGMLGPSLTRLATRLNGPKGTSSWLSAPKTAVMRSVFTDSPLTPPEVHALTAFFVDRVQLDAPGPTAQTRRFVAFGLAGAVAILLLIGSAWRGRLRPVRRGLIDRTARAAVPPATHTHGFRSGGRR
jgi:cytochrome c peroxidase